MDLTRVMNIIGTMPQKNQRLILAQADFKTRTPKDVLHAILTTAIPMCKSAAHKDLLSVYLEAPISDEVITDFFGGMAERVAPLDFTDEHIEYIEKNVYRNLEGKYRIIPSITNVSLDNVPLEGLECDEAIIEHRLCMSRRLETGAVENFNGLERLQKQHYEPPYDNVYRRLAANIQRINIISSFEKTDPVGFFKRNDKMYRNVCQNMTALVPEYNTPEGLERAMLLMYLVSGATQQNWRDLYALIHFMVKVPNSNVGYIIYLNDFDAGGNGKSKFVSILQAIFGDSFTAFEPHQLRFNISLMGKRLVHISEYEDNETSRQLQGMIKSMTGRDKFQYEGKGQNPIVSETFQNFIISSNKYIYFDDAGIKRRLQNFHCSNFLHLLLTKHFRTSKFLDKLFGNNYDGSSGFVLKQMAQSLYHHILEDDNVYDIELRQQAMVLGNFKNPILRHLFSDRMDTDGFIRDTGTGSALDLYRIVSDAKPEQYNYAASTIMAWLDTFSPTQSRDALTLHFAMPAEVLSRELKERIKELDNTSRHLKDKNSVYIENATFDKFNSIQLIEKYFGQQFVENNITLKTSENGVILQ
jgi:hypothetical protein